METAHHSESKIAACEHGVETGYYGDTWLFYVRFLWMDLVKCFREELLPHFRRQALRFKVC